jgi:hypothetical protein
VTETSDDRRVGRIACLTLSNALIFQEILSSLTIPHARRSVRNLRSCLASSSPIDSLLAEWKYVVDEINYVPIFDVAYQILVALPSGPRLLQAIRKLSDAALAITSSRSALRHDLMGRVFHTLLADAKYYGACYTTIPAATLLLKLAASGEWEVDWSNLDQIRTLRVADLACGTGTLLKACLQAIEDNHIRARIHANEKPDLAELHKALIEDALWGFDVLPFAIQLSASALALHEPDTPFARMQVRNVPLGTPADYLGTLEMRPDDARLPTYTLLTGDVVSPTVVTGMGATLQSIEVPMLDLCVMNPPFTRSVGGNLLFGSLPSAVRKRLQMKLQRRVSNWKLQANITAGLGSVFVAYADRRIKEGGRIALVLPRSVLAGIAWKQTRELFVRPTSATTLDGTVRKPRKYSLDYVVVSHEPFAWNFSEQTKLSECLIVGHKLRQAEEPAKCIFVNLWIRPKTSIESLVVAKLIRECKPPLLSQRGICELTTDGRKYGEAIAAKYVDLQKRPWVYENAFAQTELSRTVYYLSKGRVYLPTVTRMPRLPVTPLSSLAELGPDRRDIHDGFEVTDSATSYPAMWGHEHMDVRTMAQTHNKYLTPLSQAKAGRTLRDPQLLWSRSGKLMIVERLRLNTQRLTALLLGRDALSNVWWPVKFKTGRSRETAEQLTALWLNSTLGILSLLGVREDTEGAFVGFKKPSLENMGVLNFKSLKKSKKRILLNTYSDVANETLLPLSEAKDDPTRKKIDQTFADVFDIRDLSLLRELLAREPLVTMKQIS